MNAPLRVLEIVTVPISTNGLALYPIRMAERMDDRVQVDFLGCSTDPALEKRIQNMQSKLYSAPSRMRSPIRYMRYVQKIVRKQKYEVVHVHGNSCTLALDLLAAKLGGAKVRIAHSHNTACSFPILNTLLRGLFDSVYTHALACGTEAGKWLFQGKPFQVMPNAIDTGLFCENAETRVRIRRELEAENRRVLLHIGNFSEAKNPSFLMGLMEQLPGDCVLWMVGDGALRQETERIAQEKRLNVRFLGKRGDVPDLMQGADALLLPSLHEGFPTVALEAQASGLIALMSENITRKVAFSDSAQFLPLNLNAWLNAIENFPQSGREERSKAAAAALQKGGYDLKAAAIQLETNYLNWAKADS